jgi:predicted alpha/beta hydrolase family esterase
VAPADPGRWGIVDGSIAAIPFDFPSILVASETDPWLALGTARNLAQQWGSWFVNIGAAGHINVEAGFGPWTVGERLLHELRCMVDPCLAAVAR